MRGKRRSSCSKRRPCRIIPAHAGQTTSNALTRVSHADHPRACGANGGPHQRATPSSGSSPRMRGKLRDAGRDPFVLRIIPAHAGQTLGSTSRNSTVTDHPRACGANRPMNLRPVGLTGSSPRMRGKLRRDVPRFWIHRIIPAHAGQTSTCSSRDGRTPDHPRACGANCETVVVFLRPYGSSPRMRGKLLFVSAWLVESWIIPAHAGQTGFTAYVSPLVPDHPRACGANGPCL